MSIMRITHVVTVKEIFSYNYIFLNNIYIYKTLVMRLSNINDLWDSTQFIVIHFGP